MYSQASRYCTFSFILLLSEYSARNAPCSTLLNTVVIKKLTRAHRIDLSWTISMAGKNKEAKLCCSWSKLPYNRKKPAVAYYTPRRSETSQHILTFHLKSKIKLINSKSWDISTLIGHMIYSDIWCSFSNRVLEKLHQISIKMWFEKIEIRQEHVTVSDTRQLAPSIISF